MHIRFLHSRSRIFSSDRANSCISDAVRLVVQKRVFVVEVRDEVFDDDIIYISTFMWRLGIVYSVNLIAGQTCTISLQELFFSS